MPIEDLPTNANAYPIRTDAPPEGVQRKESLPVEVRPADGKAQALEPAKVTSDAFIAEGAKSVSGRGSKDVSSFREIISKVAKAISAFFSHITGSDKGHIPRLEDLPLELQLQYAQAELKKAEETEAYIMNSLKGTPEDLNRLDTKSSKLEKEIKTLKNRIVEQNQQSAPKAPTTKPAPTQAPPPQPQPVVAQEVRKTSAPPKAEAKPVSKQDLEKYEEVKNQLDRAENLLQYMMNNPADYKRAIDEYLPIAMKKDETVATRTDPTLRNALHIVDVAVDQLTKEARELRQKLP